MKIQLTLLLISLTLAACMQVDPTSQDASGDTSYLHLNIAKEKVFLDDKNKTHAGITDMELKERESFDSQVNLKKDMLFYDKSPLTFTEIKFDFSTTDKGYNCTLGKDSSEIKLLSKIPFDFRSNCEVDKTRTNLIEALERFRQQLSDPLAEVFKDAEVGFIYEEKIASASMSDKVEDVTWDGDKKIGDKIFHHYTYKENDSCELDIWIDGDRTLKQNGAKPPEYTGNGAVGYLMTYQNFISKTGGSIVIRGQHGNILIKCGENGFAYFGSNNQDQPLFTPQMAVGESYDPTGSSHLYLSGKDEGTLTIVAALRYSTGLKVKPTVTSGEGGSVMGREARIYTANTDGVEQDLSNKVGERTVVVPIHVLF